MLHNNVVSQAFEGSLEEREIYIIARREDPVGKSEIED